MTIGSDEIPRKIQSNRLTHGISPVVGARGLGHRAYRPSVWGVISGLLPVNAGPDLGPEIGPHGVEGQGYILADLAR